MKVSKNGPGPVTSMALGMGVTTCFTGVGAGCAPRPRPPPRPPGFPPGPGFCPGTGIGNWPQALSAVTVVTHRFNAIFRRQRVITLIPFSDVLLDAAAFAVGGLEALRAIVETGGTTNLFPVAEDDAGAVDVVRSIQRLVTVDCNLRPGGEGILRKAQPLRRVRRKSVHKPRNYFPVRTSHIEVHHHVRIGPFHRADFPGKMDRFVLIVPRGPVVRPDRRCCHQYSDKDGRRESHPEPPLWISEIIIRVATSPRGMSYLTNEGDRPCVKR